MPLVNNSIVKTFSEPQSRFEIAINFPQGLRSIQAKGNGAGKSFRLDLYFSVELQYSGQSTWIPLKPITVGGIFKNAFTKVVTYNGTKQTPDPLNPLIAYNENLSFSVRIKRITQQVDPDLEVDDPQYKYYDSSVLQSVTGYTNKNAITDPINTQLAKTALSIKATKQINGQLEGINAVVQTYCLDWNGSAWIMANTNNPASLYRYVLTHPANPQRILDSEVADKIDLQKLQSWHQYCSSRQVKNESGSLISKSFAFNHVVSNTRSLLEVLRDVCAAGRASPALIDGKWSVNIDQEKSIIVQHFTPHNSWGFESVKALPKIPHALKVRFFNETADYKEDELIVYNYGYNADGTAGSTAATVFESMTLPGVTDPLLIADHTQWHFAQIKLRPEIFSLNTDIEYLVCNRGDRVKVTHDVPMWGVGSGRIKYKVVDTQALNNVYSNPITCFEVDEPVLFDSTKDLSLIHI